MSGATFWPRCTARGKCSTRPRRNRACACVLVSTKPPLLDSVTTSRDELMGFVPPPYPYDRLDELTAAAEQLSGCCVDLSIGTPCDPPPPAVVAALSSSGAERGYPASIGSVAFREAAAGWMQRRLDVDVDPVAIGACIGTKEFVASAPQYLRL